MKDFYAMHNSIHYKLFYFYVDKHEIIYNRYNELHIQIKFVNYCHCCKNYSSKIFMVLNYLNTHRLLRIIVQVIFYLFFS